jgi:hypothetical protein
MSGEPGMQLEEVPNRLLGAPGSSGCLYDAKGAVSMRLRTLSSIAVLTALVVGLPIAVFASQQVPPQTVTIASTVAINDWRCFYGPGMQVWENANKGGRSMIFCGRGYWANLQDLAENLSGDRWNDRITSVETFNSNAGEGGHTWRLCTDWNNSGDCLVFNGSAYVADLTATWDNKASSIKNNKAP